MINKIFTGAGYNDSRWLRALTNALNSPSKKTLPAGATWPFVALSVSEKSVDFSMLQIKKSADPANAKAKFIRSNPWQVKHIISFSAS
jgi:hypothetical protein